MVFLRDFSDMKFEDDNYSQIASYAHASDGIAPSVNDCLVIDVSIGPSGNEDSVVGIKNDDLHSGAVPFGRPENFLLVLEASLADDNSYT